LVATAVRGGYSLNVARRAQHAELGGKDRHSRGAKESTAIKVDTLGHKCSSRASILRGAL
jgi:hypothetical protein